ncbi:MAG: hypothetical protein HYX92_14800 [Chloroflexi bacterium]|nr:hypothetical protein [Chloroflexota bacterium]
MAKAVTSVPTADKQAIRKAFPLIAKIKDGKLREAVVRAWYIAWKESPHKKLEDAPFGTAPAPGDTLVKHTNAATSAAHAMGQLLVQQYGVKINLDYVIAGAILHDLDKIVMYDKKGGKIVYTAMGQKIVHGAYGAHMAILAGLPHDVVFMIMAHSPSVLTEDRSPEGKLIHFGDIGMIRALQAATGTLQEGGGH